MKAIVIENNKIEYRDYSLPSLKAGWARIAVEYVGLCGTDVQKITNIDKNSAFIQKAPLILGHEFVGSIVDINGYTEEIQIGERIAGIPLLSCNTCQQCIKGNTNLCTRGDAIGRNINGAFAEYVDIPIENAIKIPSELSFKEAVLADVVAVCIHAIKILNSSVSNKKVLIIGDGAIGTALSIVLSIMNADITLLGKHESIGSLLKSIINVEIFNQSYDKEFDFIFETVGRKQSKTLNDSIRHIKPLGKIVVLGVFEPEFNAEIIVRNLFIKEGEMKGVNSYKREDFIEAIDIINKNKELFNPLISHVIPLINFEVGLDKFMLKENNTIKIIFTPKDNYND